MSPRRFLDTTSDRGGIVSALAPIPRRGTQPVRGGRVVYSPRPNCPPLAVRWPTDTERMVRMLDVKWPVPRERREVDDE